MSDTSVWTPILRHGAEGRALEAAFAIARELEASDSNVGPAELLDRSLLFSYTRNIDSSDRWIDAANESIEQAVSKLGGNDQLHSAGLYDGLAGCGWVIEHLQEAFGGQACDKIPAHGEPVADCDYNADIDEYLFRMVDSSTWTGSLGLQSGLSGIGLYFLQRLPCKIAIAGLKKIVEHLHARSETLPGGVAWHTPPSLLPPSLRDKYPCGYYDLTVLHGIPGIVGFLSQIANRGLHIGHANRMLDDSISWLISRRRNPRMISRYSSFYIPGIDTGHSPLNWCSGDLGIAATILLSPVPLASHVVTSAIQGLIDQCIVRRPGLSGVGGPCLCDGAMGVAHVFNRLYQSTRNEIFRRSAVAWFEYGLAMRQESGGIAGFFATGWPNDITTCFRDSSFLTGAVGIGLALLSAASPIEPRWDQRLLLSGIVTTKSG